MTTKQDNEATGHSNDPYSFEEALREAIKALPPPPNPLFQRIKVVEIWVEIGGFVGANDLFVRVSREEETAK